MAIEKGRSFADIDVEPTTPDEIQLEYIMDFCVAAYDRMEELGMTKSQLAEKLGKTPSQVTRVLGGQANITLATMAEYDAALGIGLAIVARPRSRRMEATVTTNVASSPAALTVPKLVSYEGV